MSTKKTGKQPVATVKIQLEGGKATPAPPVGTVLGPRGINLMEFVKAFNALTAKRVGELVPAIINIYADRTFTIELKVAPVSYLIKKATGVEKGSSTPATNKVGKLSKAQVKTIAETKLSDLNTTDIAAAMRSVAGTARSMGIEVEAL